MKQKCEQDNDAIRKQYQKDPQQCGLMHKFINQERGQDYIQFKRKPGKRMNVPENYQFEYSKNNLWRLPDASEEAKHGEFTLVNMFDRKKLVQPQVTGGLNLLQACRQVEKHNDQFIGIDFYHTPDFSLKIRYYRGEIGSCDTLVLLHDYLNCGF